jgi:hypothetical protein
MIAKGQGVPKLFFDMILKVWHETIKAQTFFDQHRKEGSF